ncbi:hypothetical protein HDU96_000611, partial [Phlyctochytrium bullatum]
MNMSLASRIDALLGHLEETERALEVERIMEGIRPQERGEESDYEWDREEDAFHGEDLGSDGENEDAADGADEDAVGEDVKAVVGMDRDAVTAKIIEYHAQIGKSYRMGR